jgi:hypothetical protein
LKQTRSKSESLESEVFVLDRDVDDIFIEKFLGGVEGQFEAVEASMALGVGRFLVKGHLLYLKLLILPPVALQILKPQNRHPPIPRHKMQHILQLMPAERTDVPPKPLDKLVAGLTVRIPDIVPEILQIDILLAVDDHVELVRFEDREEVGRDDLVQPIADVLDHLDHTGGAVVLASAWCHCYTRLMYSYLLLEFTIVWNPFSFSGMVICVPCSSNSYTQKFC